MTNEEEEFEEWWGENHGQSFKETDKFLGRWFAKQAYIQSCKVRQKEIESVRELEERNVILMKGTDDRDEEIERLVEENKRLEDLYNLELKRANKAEGQHFQLIMKYQNHNPTDTPMIGDGMGGTVEDQDRSLKERVKELEAALIE